jgi:hypothetical protein
MENIDKSLEILEPLHKEHDEVGKLVVEACNGKIFPMDAYCLSSINRSLHLLDGFICLMKADNYLCSMPILRMQLDSLLRLFAFTLVDDPHDFANQVLQGISVRDLKDKSKNSMTDAYLVRKMSDRNSWVDRAYNVCCSYVHFSQSHYHHLLEQSTKEESGTRNFYIGSTDENIPDESKLQAINAFKVITEGIFQCIKLWTKEERKKYNQNKLVRRFNKLA